MVSEKGEVPAPWLLIPRLEINVGLSEVFQTIPLADISDPPSVVIEPPDIAVEWVISLISWVVTEGRPEEGVVKLTLPPYDVRLLELVAYALTK